MKYINKNLLILSLIVAFGAGLFYSAPVHAETDTRSTESTASTASTVRKKDTQNQKASNLDTWLQICLTMGKNLHKYGFRYGNSGTKSTYKAALSSRRRTNCALYVSWCLQEYGALKKGQTFYIKGHGRIKKNYKWDSKKVKVIKVYKRCSSVKLKPGDVTCWAGTPHACIYAGRNKAGKSLWYDGGKVATYSNRNGARYKKFTVRHLGYLDRRKISYIIRIKDL